MMKGKNLKENSKGFTLIELLLATAILTVIMAPLMRNFMMAANVLGQSTQYGLTTTAMENAAELVLTSEFDNVSDLTEVERLLSTLPSTDGSGVTVVDWTDSDPASTSSGYTVKNVAMGSYEGTMDVIITPIDPSASAGDYSYNALYADVNQTEFSSYTAMDLTMVQPGLTTYSPTYGWKHDWDEGDVVSDEYVELHEASQVDFVAKNTMVLGSSSLTNVEREIHFYVQQFTKNIGGTNYPMAKYSTVYHYTATNTAGTPVSYSKEVFAGECSVGTDGVLSAQLVYFPLYDAKDTIKVFNGTDTIDAVPMKFFLIKQDVTTSGDPTRTAGYKKPFTDGTVYAEGADEATYRGYVELYDNPITPPMTASDPDAPYDFRLYTNMNYNVTGNYTVALTESNFSFSYYTISSYGETVVDGEVTDRTYTGPLINSTSLEDKLVANTDENRGFNVLVNAYDSDGKLINQTMTVKLN